MPDAMNPDDITAYVSNLDDTTASTGQPGTGAIHLDRHFETCRPEYEAALISVGLQPGWHVLDAGCGSGAFLPLIADQIGPGGSVTAIDIAPDNVAIAKERLAASRVGCPVDIQVGSIVELPFPDNHFDAVWVGSVLMYLSDHELERALRECHRVVRPGGLLAVKEGDEPWSRTYPADPMVVVHLLDAEYERLAEDRSNSIGDWLSGSFRSRELRHWMERAGYVDTWQTYVTVERWAPLTATERAFFIGRFSYLAALAEEVELSDDERIFWRQQQDPESPDHLLNQPDFYFGEGHVVAAGRVPVA